MKTINSISGGKTSAYIAANYPADYNLFALVRTNDPLCKFPDDKLRQIVSDKIGTEFVGTLEMDDIIYTMLDLEQHIGSSITWVSGNTFEDVIKSHGDYLPNIMARFCTTDMKLLPIFNWWNENIDEPVEMRIGFRANETRRANNMIDNCNENGLLSFKHIVGKTQSGRNRWANKEWQKPVFPLINDIIFKDKIEEYWSNKNVRFAYMNNCVGCFHRSPILLKHMSNRCSNKFDWFIKQEGKTKNKINTWKKELSYEKIKNHKSQIQLFDDDFNECDSGYCGL